MNSMSSINKLKKKKARKDVRARKNALCIPRLSDRIEYEYREEWKFQVYFLLIAVKKVPQGEYYFIN